MNANRERIAKLQQEMKAEGMEMYLVPTADFISLSMWEIILRQEPGFQALPVRQVTLVVTQDQACLWTDGRYFIQAAKQLEGYRGFPDENG